MKASELRRRYLEYFVAHEHRLMPSSPLVPNDPTLLFTAAGMVQFKDVFWGRVAPTHGKVTTCQKCFRTTDIEEVGRTAFHHTFFEMLGNFSFGEYFKQGAIELAWAFLTKELGLPVERLSVSVYEDDDEAFSLWSDGIGLPTERITRLGKKHNWWGPVGDSGPCGPDSEIFYDCGADKACGPDCQGVACDCSRYSEIWNLVFMEYDAQEDGSLHPLARKNIDTGMGLERTSAALQGVDSNFDLELFRPIMDAIAAKVPKPIGADAIAYRNTIADHMRGILFLLAEGVFPGNEKQGYVLRRILRRAIRASERLELPTGALATFIDPVIDSLGDVYPEIADIRETAGKLIAREEDVFRRTLRDGERRLQKALDDLSGSGDSILPGEVAFELNDTYGFPLEMTQEIASERGVEIDLDGFERALEAQRKRSRSAIDADVSVHADADRIPAGKAPSTFRGYDTDVLEAVLENAVGQEGKPTQRFVFAETPFYAEAGGQVGDTGTIENLSRPGTAQVSAVTKNDAGVYLHGVTIVTGTFEIGDRCRLSIDAERRRRIERNHTATHLLHKALRETLGAHVKQAGSEVSDEELRFDFSHFEKMTPAQIAQAEDMANQAVLCDLVVEPREMPLAEATKEGAIGLFEDEYRGKELVRVLTVRDPDSGEVTSKELCGGTHVRRTGEIGSIKIVSEESIASGVRRLRALTGDAVLTYIRDRDALAADVRRSLGDDWEAGLKRLRDETQELKRRLDEISSGQVETLRDELVSRAQEIGGVRLIAGRVALAADLLKELADRLEEAATPAVIVLSSESEGRGLVVCKVSAGVEAVNAGTIVRAMSKALGGGGGGPKGFAQGGGPNPDALNDALQIGIDDANRALQAT